MVVVNIFMVQICFNDAIGDISEEDLLFMELLNKPKAKSTMIKKIKDSLFSADKAQTGKHQNAMAGKHSIMN